MGALAAPDRSVRHMKIIPTKRQWKGWSLPSKATYISMWLAIFGLLITLGSTLKSFNVYNDINDKTSINQGVINNFSSLDQIAQQVTADVGNVSQSQFRSNRPCVIVFEENHASIAGQIEIAVMLNRLYEKCGVKDVAQEGVFIADGTLDTTWYQPSLHQNAVLSLKDEVAVTLLSEGEISAAEMLSLLYEDYKIHGIEKAVEYNIDITGDETAAPLFYLLAIAATTSSDEELSVFKTMLDQGRQKESFEYLLNCNEISRKFYSRYKSSETDISSEQFLKLLKDIEKALGEVKAEVPLEHQKSFCKLKTFYERAGVRSDTMVESLIERFEMNTNRIVVLIIGSAHSSKVLSRLREHDWSFALVRPNSFTGTVVEGSMMSTEAFQRVTEGKSLDISGLGALLDTERKPPPRVSKVWLRSKAEIYWLTTEIAHLGISGHPMLSTRLRNILGMMQYVTFIPDSFISMYDNYIFAIQAQVPSLSEPVKVWARVTKRDSYPHRTLEAALLSLHRQFRHRVERKVRVQETRIAQDVIAVFSKDEHYIKARSPVNTIAGSNDLTVKSNE